MIEGIGSIVAVTFSPDDSLVATGCASYDARIFDAETGKLRHECHHKDRVSALTFSPDGASLYTGCFDGIVRCWSVSSGSLEWQFQAHGEPISCMLLGGDGSRLATVSGLDQRSRDDFEIVTPDSALRVWELPSRRKVYEYAAKPTEVLVALGPIPGDESLVAVGWDKELRVISMATGIVRERYGCHERIVSLATSPNGQFIGTAGLGPSFQVFDRVSKKELNPTTGHFDEVESLAVMPDNASVLSGSYDRTAITWDLNAGVESRRKQWPENLAADLAISPDGLLAASALGSNRRAAIAIWNPRNGEQIRRISKVPQNAVLGKVYFSGEAGDSHLFLGKPKVSAQSVAGAPGG